MIHLGVESVCRKLIIWFVWFVVDKQELGARTNICVVCLPLCGQLKGFPSDSNVHNLYSQMMKPSSLNNDYDNTSLARQLLAWVQWRVNHFFSICGEMAQLFWGTVFKILYYLQYLRIFLALVKLLPLKKSSKFAGNISQPWYFRSKGLQYIKGDNWNGSTDWPNFQTAFALYKICFKR